MIKEVCYLEQILFCNQYSKVLFGLLTLILKHSVYFNTLKYWRCAKVHRFVAIINKSREEQKTDTCCFRDW